MTADPILLTPGPLTTSLRTKQSMLHDWGSWDGDFNAITARVRESLLRIVHGEGTHECVPLQGSGTFCGGGRHRHARAARAATCSCPLNGAYCQRIARICKVLGRRV